VYYDKGQKRLAIREFLSGKLFYRYANTGVVRRDRCASRLAEVFESTVPTEYPTLP